MRQTKTFQPHVNHSVTLKSTYISLIIAKTIKILLLLKGCPIAIITLAN